MAAAPGTGDAAEALRKQSSESCTSDPRGLLYHECTQSMPAAYQSEPVLSGDADAKGATLGGSSSAPTAEGRFRKMGRSTQEMIKEGMENARALRKRMPVVIPEAPINHVMEYDTRELGTWSALTSYSGTIWANPLLWQAAGRLMCISMAIAVFMLFQPDPESVKKTNFMQLADALKVFVCFLLGFFMKSSIKRWSTTVDGFLVLFNSSRNLNMQFHALGLPKEPRSNVARFGVLSAMFLHHELNSRSIQDKAEKAETMDQVLADLIAQGELTEAESVTMAKVSDRAGLCWIWVASLLGRLAQDGEIPPMASPTYGRLITLAQVAQDGIRQVRVSVSVQSPFVYVHTLAFLVHVNNMFCALAFGCVVGTGVASICSRNHFAWGYKLWGDDFVNTQAARGSLSGDVQTIITSFLTCVVFPILLQAFLQIGLLLAQPFDSVSAIPTLHLIKQLQRDLKDQDIVADEPSGWEKPQFKK